METSFSTTLFEIAVVVALALLNGVLAMSETAMVSARTTRLRGRADAGDEGARIALALVREPNRFLSTVQIGITLVGVFAGALGGATLAATLASGLESVPVLAPYARPLALGIVVVAIVYLSLVLGELVPKRLALGAPEAIASFAARPMRLLSRMAGPIVWFLGFSTDIVLRLLRVREDQEPSVTEQEIRLLLDEGVRVGTLERSERELAARALRLDDRPVREIMTPRPNIVWLDAEGTPEAHWRLISRSKHSYFPVARGNLDELIGLVSVKEALARSVAEGSFVDVIGRLESPPFVSETAPASRLLELFARPGSRVAIVIDERGHLEGLATPTDVLKALVGDIPEAGETIRSPVVEREDGSWLVDGTLPVEELKEIFGFDGLPGEPVADYRTTAGMALHLLGRIPVPGDRFEWGDFSFEIVDMDGYRVDKLLLYRRTPL